MFFMMHLHFPLILMTLKFHILELGPHIFKSAVLLYTKLKFQKLDFDLQIWRRAARFCKWPVRAIFSFWNAYIFKWKSTFSLNTFLNHQKNHRIFTKAILKRWDPYQEVRKIIFWKIFLFGGIKYISKIYFSNFLIWISPIQNGLGKYSVIFFAIKGGI